jgi:hypothetical protein
MASKRPRVLLAEATLVWRRYRCGCDRIDHARESGLGERLKNVWLGGRCYFAGAKCRFANARPEPDLR